MERKHGNCVTSKGMNFFSSCDVVFLEDQFPGVANTDYVTPPIF